MANLNDLRTRHARGEGFAQIGAIAKRGVPVEAFNVITKEIDRSKLDRIVVGFDDTDEIAHPLFRASRKLTVGAQSTYRNGMDNTPDPPPEEEADKDDWDIWHPHDGFDLRR